MDGQRRSEREGRHDHVAGSREGEDFETILLKPLDLLFRWLCVSLTQDSAYGKAALLWSHLIKRDRQTVSEEERLKTGQNLNLLSMEAGDHHELG